MPQRALLPLFLQFAEADFACVAANLFAGYSPRICHVAGFENPSFFSPWRRTVAVPCGAGFCALDGPRESVMWRGSRTPLSSVRGGGLCLCSREFIRREYSPGLVIRQGSIAPVFLVRRGRRYPVQPPLKIAGDSCELAQDN